MKKCLSVLAAFTLISSMSLAFAQENYPDQASVEIRQEFEASFGPIKLYKAIKIHLPEQYEELFRSYEKAKRADDMGELKLASFINSIRRTHLQQSSDQAILAFYDHIVRTGRQILQQDPEAAFSYLFGGNPGSYASYVDYETELEFLGDLFDRILASSRPENALAIDRQDVEITLNMIYLGLFQKHGEPFFLLHGDRSQLSSSERYQLCDIYLGMHEEIFQLPSPSRGHVLRSFAMRL
ncbi:MAG: hypothetical protein IH614_15175 [Desulfuromonadales bacterium]|nr:hypothetical protein [Desulfuromonadales bacterium]